MRRLILSLLLVAACSKQETVTSGTTSTEAYPEPTATTADIVTPTYTAPDTTATTAVTTSAVTTTSATTTTSAPMPVPTQTIPSILRRPEGVDMSSVPASAAARIGLSEAKEKLASGEAILVDVRLPEAFATDHAKGAINVPATMVADNLGRLPRDKMIITYCT